MYTKQTLESRSSDVAAGVLTVYRYTHTHTQRHILIELEKWEGAITRTSQRETKRRKERNYTMSRSQQTGDYFPKGRRMMDCK